MDVEDIKKAVAITKEYKETFDIIGDLDIELKKLEEKKNMVLEKLKDIEQRELELTKQLKEKYGELDYNEILNYVVSNPLVL